MIFLVFIWVGGLVLLSKLKLKFFKFIVGSVGIFFFLIYYGNTVIETRIIKVLAFLLDFIANKFSSLKVYPEYGMITIYGNSEIVTFFLDYECTGILEILVFFSLVSFYPIYGLLGKIYYMTIGVIYITIVNVTRVLVIVFIVQVFGMKYFFLAHTILARIIFFVFVVALYYKTFTVKHISKQSVGDHS